MTQHSETVKLTIKIHAMKKLPKGVYLVKTEDVNPEELGEYMKNLVFIGGFDTILIYDHTTTPIKDHWFFKEREKG